MGYGDYLEQLAYPIFLKMADEYARPRHKHDIGTPKGRFRIEPTRLRGPRQPRHAPLSAPTRSRRPFR
ncbi:hypothetical protein GCM10017624_33930 [Azotobacter vinelandii]|nr:hypothetical protein GCM10017624_33930 [Azotobacter vinelandii]